MSKAGTAVPASWERIQYTETGYQESEGDGTLVHTRIPSHCPALCVPHSHIGRALCRCTAVGKSGQEGAWDPGLLPLSAPSSLLT